MILKTLKDQTISNEDIFLGIKSTYFQTLYSIMEISGKTISYVTFKNKLKNENE